MLAFTGPGIIEVLPALPSSLIKGSTKRMLATTFAKINNLTWNLQKQTVDLTIISLKKHDITLISRYGIENVSTTSGVLRAFKTGNANCGLHLPENESVEIHLKLGNHNPLEWVNQII
jgi:alpha-L-fucosidase 2